MNPTTLLAFVLAATFFAFGMAKLLAVPSMQARAAHVGFSIGAYRWIGVLEVAGAAGLVIGAAAPLLRALAALGLLMLLAGAVLTHLRVEDGIKDMAPALVLACLVIALLAVEAPRL